MKVVKDAFPEFWEERPKFSEKVKDIIIYLTFSMKCLPLVRLTKLIYISEFYSGLREKRRMTDIKFFKYYYGPWSFDIEYTGTVIAGEEILMVEKETKEGYQGVFFEPNLEQPPTICPSLSNEEFEILTDVVNDWKYMPNTVLLKLCKSTPLFLEAKFGERLKIEKILKEKNPHVLGYEILVTKEEESCYFVECPSLPGCVSQGKTEEKAIENIKDAIIAYIECVTNCEQKNAKITA
ncbi:MAG TPA: type II toxin-antitoxin system HicB family antitoxin [Candidatus Bathyarchaeia archaeon]|nr:type II toxin-antitoxin system HicB family antitoxin [Candidatus Bathyarchaeia archaeon]